MEKINAPTKKGLKKTTRIFLISLALLIVCSLVNWGIVTGWGNVRITRLTLVGDDGLDYSALMYTPKSATNDTPAPGIMMFHGGSGNARNHEAWAVEFSRRGFVVISIDNMGAGNGEFSGRSNNETCDMFTKYMFSNPIVDNSKIVISGHSLGGGMTVTMSMKYNSAVAIISDGGERVLAKTEKPYNGNMLVVAGLADKSCEYEGFTESIRAAFIRNGTITEETDFQSSVVYGSFAEGNANQLVWIPGQIHEGVFVNHKHIETIVDFTQNAIDAPNPIAANEQIWHWKDVCGFIGMFLFVFTMLSFALMMVDCIPFFSSIKQPMPRNIGMRGKDLAISIILSLVFPVLVLWTGAFGIVELLGGAKGLATDIFRVRFTHIHVSIIFALNMFGLIMFFLYHKVWGKKNFNATIRDYGLTSEGRTTIDWALIGKAFLLAVITASVGWTYMGVQDDVLGTDFYCLFFGFKDIPLRKFVYYIPHFIVWIPCFAVAAVGMNVERRLPSTGKDWLDDVIAVIFNGLLATAAITVMIIIENSIQLNLGTTATALASWKTDITRLWGMPVGMFLGGAGSTYCYRKTGNIWLGAILMGIVCCLASCLYGQTYPIGTLSVG